MVSHPTRPSSHDLSFGMYPEVSLKLARERRDEARLIIRKGIDPGAQRKAEKIADAEAFEAVAREWFEKFAPSWAESHSSKVIRRLEMDVFPWLGARVATRRPICAALCRR